MKTWNPVARGYLVMMCVLFVLGTASAARGNWGYATITLGSLFVMVCALGAAGLGAAAKRGDRVEPDRDEEGQA